MEADRNPQRRASSCPAYRLRAAAEAFCAPLRWDEPLGMGDVNYDRSIPEAVVIAARRERAQWVSNLQAAPAISVQVSRPTGPNPITASSTLSRRRKVIATYRHEHPFAARLIGKLLGWPLEATGPAYEQFRPVALRGGVSSCREGRLSGWPSRYQSYATCWPRSRRETGIASRAYCTQKCTGRLRLKTSCTAPTL